MRWLALLILLAPGAAWAGPFDTFGFDARGIGLGGAMTASADDHTALYYNPAGLTLRGQSMIGLGVMTALPDLNIELDAAPSDPGLSPAEVSPTSGISAGGVLSMGDEDQWALGGAIFTPFGDLLDLELLDPQIPQWLRYDALPRKVHILGGLGWRPTDWLHLGVGVQILARIEGGGRFELDLVGERVTRRDAALELIPEPAPTAGINVRVAPGVRAGLTWRSEMDLTFDLPIVFNLGNGTDAVLPVRGITLYTPHQIALGLAWDMDPLLGVPVHFTVDATWAMWGLAPDPSLDLTIDLRGEIPEGAGLGEALDFDIASPVERRLEDTIEVRGGVEWGVTQALTLRAGYGFRPGAIGVPDHPADNYLDPDAHIVALGAGFSAPNPLEEAQRPFSIDIAAQITALSETRVDKGVQDDPIGPFDAKGTIATFSLTFRQDL